MSVDLAARLDSLLRPVFAGRRCILVGSVFSAAHAAVRQCLQLGASRPVLVVCDAIGVGPPPDPADAVPLLVDVRGVSTIETIRHFERALDEPSRAVLSALHDFDPDRSALVLGSPFSAAPALDGRSRFGRRRPEWAAFEDKTNSVELLADAGALPATVEVVPNTTEDIVAAVTASPSRLGVVVAGDMAAGHSGFAEYSRWVREPSEVGTIPGCERVRVMSFLAGVPCSIHGIVVGDAVAVFRPAELLTLVDDRRRFVFAGAATYWDPPAANREQMRAVARRIGLRMAEEASYRGAFNVDGILTSDGFVATEINARWGGALNLVAGAAPELPLFLLDHALREGVVDDVDVETLEQTVLDAADRQRTGAAVLSIPADWVRGDVEATVLADGAASDDAWDWRLLAGRVRGGVHVRAVPRSDLPVRATPFAPLAVRGVALCGHVLGAPVGRLRAQVTVAGH